MLATSRRGLPKYSHSFRPIAVRMAGLLISVAAAAAPAAGRELVLEGVGEVARRDGASFARAGDSVVVWVSLDIERDDLEPDDEHFGLYPSAEADILVLSVGLEFARIVCEAVSISVADNHETLGDAIHLRGDWCFDALGTEVLGVDLILHDESETTLQSDAIPRRWPDFADFDVSGVSWEACADSAGCSASVPEIGVTASLTALPEPGARATGALVLACLFAWCRAARRRYGPGRAVTRDSRPGLGDILRLPD